MSTSVMNQRLFTRVAAILLALIAAGHVLRLAYAVEVIVGGTVIPVGVSIPVVVVMAGLAWRVWRESQDP